MNNSKNVRMLIIFNGISNKKQKPLLLCRYSRYPPLLRKLQGK